MAESVDRLSRRLLETMVVGLELRIYRRLIDLVASFRAPNNTATIPLCQASLADLVRATRLSSKQMLHRLVDQGQVRVRRGRIDVLDIDALSRRCGY
ncbi:helix-turn-helix domain-containing protein [Kribbella sp. NBC_00359]|uniref:helix-turn-helix domain-containing protein n=1 Tax=Kribbella sp. NBC_00359 TaxID=2975966 RepID=UPI002E1FA958